MTETQKIHSGKVDLGATNPEQRRHLFCMDDISLPLPAASKLELAFSIDMTIPDAAKSRSRSRSPYSHGSSHQKIHRRHRSRSRSPRHATSHSPKPVPFKPLPYGARELSRYDLTRYNSLFALYLDVQKRIVLEDLNEKEVRGRWKSFAGKW